MMILAHMEMNRGKRSKMNWGKQTERGQELMRRAVGMAKAECRQANKKARRTRQLQADTAGRLSARHRPQRNIQQMAGLAAITTAADDVGWPLAVQCRWGECSGAGSQEGGLRPT